MGSSRRLIVQCLSSAVALLALLPLPRACAQTEFKGMSLFGYGDLLGNPGLYESLYDMKTLGVDTVALNTWWKQDSKTSNTIYENVGGMSASKAQIENAIDMIHGLGMKVYFKPNLDPGDGVWRALIAPTNPNAWFASYQSYIGQMADIAQAKGVELFSIGTEMESMANKASYAPQWTSIINDVRSRYAGPVTYAANHGDAVDGAIHYGDYRNVPWWNQLDYIGVDAYFPLTNKTNPTQAELNSAWGSRASSIESWRSSAGLSNKQVLFTEVGYGAFDGTNMTPWGPGPNPTPDANEQRDAYNALLTTMTPKSWWDGAFWWSWETQPHAGLQQPTGFTPQDRPAMQTLANFYGGTVPPPAPRPVELLATWDSGFEGVQFQNGATGALSSIGVTNGASSLAVTTPNQSFNWAVAMINTAAAGDNYSAWYEAAKNPAGHAISFDVTYNTATIPQQGVTFVALYAAVNSPAGWSQVDNLAPSNGRTNQTIHVTIPLSSFALAQDSTWYSFYLAVQGNWGANPATIYLDNLRLTDLTPDMVGDFDGNGIVDVADLASWEYGFGLFRHGDADKDRDTDGADLLLWQRQLGSIGVAASAVATPEPASAILAAAALLAAQRAFPVLGLRKTK